MVSNLNHYKPLDFMNYLPILFTFLFVQYLPTFMSGQLSSIDIGISTSENQDYKYDQEYLYEFAETPEMYHITVGAQFNISSKFTLTPKVAYSRSSQSLSKSQISFGSGTLKDMTFIRKNKTSIFLKSGVALSYWIISRGKGFFLDGQLQGLFNVSAKSEEIKFIGFGEVEQYTIDFKEEVRPFVPSLRLSFGYRLGLGKRFSIYFLVGKEIRASSYYTNRHEFQLITRTADVRFNYKI